MDSRLKMRLSTPLTVKECKKLPTPRLLAFYKKNRRLRNMGRCECCGECLSEEKQELNDICNEYMDNVKSVLDSREHCD